MTDTAPGTGPPADSGLIPASPSAAVLGWRLLDHDPWATSSARLVPAPAALG